MTFIRCTRNVGIRGASHAIGDVVEVSDQDALTLIRMGKAVPSAPPDAATLGEPTTRGKKPAKQSAAAAAGLTTTTAGALVSGTDEETEE